MNSIQNIKTGAPQSIEIDGAPNLDNLSVQITERLESIVLKGNTGTKNPFERAADLLRQQEEEANKESDLDVELSIPIDAILNGGDTICTINSGEARDYYWQLTNINTESTAIPTIDQRGNISLEEGKWAEFDVKVKRYADASWKKSRNVINLFERIPGLNQVPEYIVRNILDYYLNYEMLEHLNANNTTNNWINTGVAAKDVEVYVDFTTSTSTNAAILGTATSSYGLELLHWQASGSNTGSFVYINGNTNIAQKPQKSNAHNIWSVTKDKIMFDVDGESIEYNNTKGLSTSEETVKIYRAYYSGSVRTTTYPIALLKLSKQDSTIWHGIPSKRKSDGVLGYYDFVNGVFHTNAGTDTFLAGEVIEVGSEEYINKLM